MSVDSDVDILIMFELVKKLRTVLESIDPKLSGVSGGPQDPCGLDRAAGVYWRIGRDSGCGPITKSDRNSTDFVEWRAKRLGD